VTVVQQLAKALARTHAEGIIHRDVKPSNVFLVEGEGEIFVKLLDFGLAQSLRSADSSMAMSRPGGGTPPYMSPEQISGGSLDARSDIWSLGAVAFECLTGRRPFQGETAGAIARNPYVGLASPDRGPSKPSWRDRRMVRTGVFSVARRTVLFTTEASEAISKALCAACLQPDPNACRSDRPGVDRTITDAGRPPTRGRHIVRATSRRWIATLAVAATLGTIGTGIHLAHRPVSARPDKRSARDVPRQPVATVDRSDWGTADALDAPARSEPSAERLALLRRIPHGPTTSPPTIRASQTTAPRAIASAADADTTAPRLDCPYELPQFICAHRHRAHPHTGLTRMNGHQH
jgi:serine/threonine protein kinase